MTTEVEAIRTKHTLNQSGSAGGGDVGGDPSKIPLLLNVDFLRSITTPVFYEINRVAVWMEIKMFCVFKNSPTIRFKNHMIKKCEKCNCAYVFLSFCYAPIVV